jgi:DNA ligase-associated metallophosphoesterase
MMIAETNIKFGATEFIATSESVLYHHATGKLIISDCHFGKTTHFRRHALPIPESAIQKDLLRLESIANRLNPKEIIFLGDLFHSHENREWNILSEFLYTRIKCPLTLVLGNHDILNQKLYEKAGFVIKKQDTIGDIDLLHDISDSTAESIYSISGHLHPGFRIKGSGRQQILLPCFYMGANSLIMPAFGSLTGLAVMQKKQKSDRVFCFTSDRIFEVS